MSKTAIIWLIVAAALVFLSMIFFVITMSVNDWDFTKLSTFNYETNEHEIRDSFVNISVKTDTADIQFIPYDGGNCKVVCFENSKTKHDVSVKEGTLTVQLTDDRKWYDYIGIQWGKSKITVYLPETVYASLYIKESTGNIDIPQAFSFETIDITTSTGDVKNAASASGDVKISTSTGNIYLQNIAAGSLTLSVTTGNVTASDIACVGDLSIRVSTGKTNLATVSCTNLHSTGSTGDITLNNVVASEKLSVERSTGDVKFEGSDASEIFVETDTGDVTGNLLSDKVFIVQTDTGKMDVPKTITGGRCEVVTDTGDIIIKVTG